MSKPTETRLVELREKIRELPIGVEIKSTSLRRYLSYETIDAIMALFQEEVIRAQVYEHELYKESWKTAIRRYGDDPVLLGVLNKLIEATDFRITKLQREVKE